MARTSTGSGTTITCVISQKSRPTTYPYLTDKATRLGVSVADLKKFYICREVVTQLNKGVELQKLVKDEVSFNQLLQEKTLDEMVALNTRSKKNTKSKVVTPKAVRTDDPDSDIDLQLVDADPVVEKVLVNEPLSPETEAYLKQKAELLGGQHVVDEIHAKVWGEEEVEEVEEVMA